MSKDYGFLLDLIDKIEPVGKEKEASLNSSDIALQTQMTDLELRREELRSNIQDREERKKFADKIFILLASFIAVTLYVIVLVGFGYLELDNAVLITILSTMSANVIGIFIYVVKYLFKSNVCPNCGIKITQSQTIKS